MPKLKPSELELRRTEIIDAAHACFLRSGFHRTTTDDICHEANITPGGLYHYFASKEELIAAVIEKSAEKAVQSMRDLVNGSGSTETALLAVSQTFARTLDNPEIDNATRLELEIWAEGLMNDELLEKSRRAWLLRLDWLEELVQRGIEAGIYDHEAVDPRAMASFLIAVYLGMRMGRLLGPKFDVSGAVQTYLSMRSGNVQSTIPALSDSPSAA